jgi:hypothetical protein
MLDWDKMSADDNVFQSATSKTGGIACVGEGI